MFTQSLHALVMTLADPASELFAEDMGLDLEASSKAGLPQFDAASFLPQIIWLVITFGVFYFFMSRLVLPRIGDVLEDREERIADDLDQAQQLSEEASSLQDTFEGSLGEARGQSLQTIADARAHAQAQIDEKAAALDAKLAKQAEDAEHRIAAEKSAALGELGSVATDVCEDVIEKLLGQSADKAAIKKAVKDEISRRGA